MESLGDGGTDYNPSLQLVERNSFEKKSGGLPEEEGGAPPLLMQIPLLAIGEFEGDYAFFFLQVKGPGLLGGGVERSPVNFHCEEIAVFFAVDGDAVFELDVVQKEVSGKLVAHDNGEEIVDLGRWVQGRFCDEIRLHGKIETHIEVVGSHFKKCRFQFIFIAAGAALRIYLTVEDVGIQGKKREGIAKNGRLYARAFEQAVLVICIGNPFLGAAFD